MFDLQLLALAESMSKKKDDITYFLFKDDKTLSLFIIKNFILAALFFFLVKFISPYVIDYKKIPQNHPIHQLRSFDHFLNPFYQKNIHLEGDEKR